MTRRRQRARAHGGRHCRSRSALKVCGPRAEERRWSFRGSLDEMARDLVARLDRSEERTLGRLPQVKRRLLAEAVRTTRIEAAAARRVAEIRWRAGNSGQPGQRPSQGWERLQEPLRVRVLRVRGEALGRRGLDDLTRVHD